MNVCYVSHEFGPVTGGGIGTYVHNACQALAQAGHSVFLLTDCFDRANRRHLPAGVTLVETVPDPEGDRSSYFNANQGYAYRVLRTLRGLAREHPLDVVEFPDYCAEGFATVRARRLLNEFPGTRLIVKCHTPRSLLFEINEARSLTPDDLCDFEMEDYCIRHADLVTSPSDALARSFAARVGRNDIRRCPYPLHLPRLEAPRKFDRSQTRRVRFVGSVQVRKGVDVFIAAAQRVLEVDPGFHFEIYGKDRNEDWFGRRYLEWLDSRIPSNLRDRIRFAGAVDYASIPALLKSTCFCVLPSRWENWANACLEAMSMGCVVIASNQGGMAEMIEHGKSGFLVPPQQPDAIADLILKHHENLAELESLSRAARLRSHALADPELTLNQMLANYASPCAPRPWRRAGTSKVSVVIPFYNQGAFLPEAVESVRQSAYSNLEIIVVNDGSTEAESKRVFDQLDGVTKVRQANAGLSAARNAGIRAATGEFVLTLDADDRIDSRYLEAAVDALTNQPDLAYVTCHAQNFGALDTVYVPVGFVPALMPFLSTDGKCANVFRREVFTRCSYDESMVSYEDWDLLLSLHERGYQGDVLPEKFLFYRRRPDSMVYTVANPRRTALVQYMMIKHRGLLAEHGSRMAVVLSFLWKQAELEGEKLTSHQAPVHWRDVRRLFRRYLKRKIRRLLKRPLASPSDRI